MSRGTRFDPRTRFTSAAGIDWRRLDSRLWAGRREDRPVGVIERGRSWSAFDLDCASCGRHASFEDAERALLAGSMAAGDDLRVGGGATATVILLVVVVLVMTTVPALVIGSGLLG